MINLGGNWDEVHWPDNWTATTVDGKRSAQFEETLLCVCHISRAPASIDRSSGSRKRVLKCLQQGSHGICSDIACSDEGQASTLFWSRINLAVVQVLLCDVGIVVILGQVRFIDCRVHGVKVEPLCKLNFMIDMEPGARR